MDHDHVVHIHEGIHDSARKSKKKPMPFKTIGLDRDILIQSEVRDKERSHLDVESKPWHKGPCPQNPRTQRTDLWLS